MRITTLAALVLALSTAACLPMTGASSYGSSTYATPTYAAGQTYGTGIFVNGHELTVAEKAEFEAYIGEPVPAARYTVLPNGDTGYEGQPPVTNIAERYRQNHQAGGGGGHKPFNMYSTDTSGRGSSIVSEGGCTILSTPDGSLSSGC